MKFVVFSVSENGEKSLGDEGADEGNVLRIFELEPPLSESKTLARLISHNPDHHKNLIHWSLSHAPCTSPKISSESVNNFLSNLADDRQTNTAENITSFLRRRYRLVG